MEWSCWLEKLGIALVVYMPLLLGLLSLLLLAAAAWEGLPKPFRLLSGILSWGVLLGAVVIYLF